MEAGLSSVPPSVRADPSRRSRSVERPLVLQRSSRSAAVHERPYIETRDGSKDGRGGTGTVTSSPLCPSAVPNRFPVWSARPKSDDAVDRAARGNATHGSQTKSEAVPEAGSAG